MAKSGKRIYTPEQVRFQEWLALPKQLREPKTQRALAPLLGVGEDVLSEWKKLEGFVDTVASLARQHLKSELPEIFGALAREAKAGDVPAIKLVAQITDQLIERHDVTSDGEPIQLMWPKPTSDDETD